MIEILNLYYLGEVDGLDSIGEIPHLVWRVGCIPPGWHLHLKHYYF